jgi:mannan endo-1,4-beta-mannosidase
MLYDRLVNFHKLDNLVWVWNANEVKETVKDYQPFYPGHDTVDVLATDVYSGRYDDKNYHMLMELAEGRPIGLGEIGKLPTPAMLAEQNQWVWFMSWRDPDNFFWNDGEALTALFSYDKSTGLHELPWYEGPDVIRLHTPVMK